MATDRSLYGRSPEEWADLTDGTVKFLRGQASLGRTTNYTEVNHTLQRRHGARRFDFDLDSERAAMGHLLGLATRRRVRRHRPHDLVDRALSE